MKKFLFVLLLAVGCAKAPDAGLIATDCPPLVYGTKVEKMPVGVWKYFDLDSSILLKIDFQIGLVDTMKIEQMRKYFSKSGQLISVDGVYGNESLNLYNLRGSTLGDDHVGEILVNEYCGTCHKMYSRFVAQEFHGMTLSDSVLTRVFRDRNHAVTKGDLIWEDKSDFSFLSGRQVQCIVKYINHSESTVAGNL